MAVMAVTEGLDCRNCSETQQQDRGCKVDSLIPGRWQINGYSSNRCPVAISTNQSMRYLESYGLFESGVLPRGGGWILETKKFIDAMKIIKKELQQWQKMNSK